jgi:sugar phosphate isomerase/epimerase
VGKWTPIQIGQGLVDYDSIFKVLKDNNFDGWVAIEEASGNGWQGIDDAVGFAKKYVR